MSTPTHWPDREARFVALYDATYADVLRFVQRRTSASVADDVTAEAFLVVWRRLEDVPVAPDDARAWTFGIARNVLLNARRAAERSRALGVRLRDHGGTDSTDGGVESVGTRVDVARAWQRLSEVHQEALALTVLDGLSAPQVAEVLDISAVAYRLRLSRARRALRAHLTHLPTHPTEALR